MVEIYPTGATTVEERECASDEEEEIVLRLSAGCSVSALRLEEIQWDLNGRRVHWESVRSLRLKAPSEKIGAAGSVCRSPDRLSDER